MANSSDADSASDERLHELIAEYHKRADCGETMIPAAFCTEHAEHAEALRRYFDNVAVVEQLAGPRSDGRSDTEGTVIASETAGAFQDQTIIEVSGSRTSSLRVAPDAPPTQFGRYRILKELGRGAMGAVYLAQDEQLDRKVALKIPQFGGGMNSVLLERFYREARAAGNLRHNGICPIYDVGVIDGQHYITMAYIEGRPLREFSKSSRRQNGKQVARVIRKIAMAMAEAHAQNIIHRDLKPANVMIDQRNEPVVMDFGLARRATENEERLTHTGTVIGTPAYMSPEQVDGDNDNVGPAADIYSLGVMFYELLTGELPFQGNLMSILKKIATETPRPPIELHGDIDPVLQKLCLKMLEKKPQDRPASMQAVVKELSDWLQGKHAPTDESGMLETSRAPGRKRAKRSGQSEATEPMAAADEVGLNRKPSVEPSRDRQTPGKRGLMICAALSGFALLAGIVFVVNLGGRYDVRITVDDPAIALKVDGESVVIDGAGAPIRLSAGPHALAMSRDGLESEVSEFAVTKDGRTAVHVAIVEGRLMVLTDGRPAGSRAKTESPADTSVAIVSPESLPQNLPPSAVAPFNESQAMQHQKAWAEYLGLPVEIENSIGMKFVLIPPGEFLMGSSAAEVAEQLREVENDSRMRARIESQSPQHRVILTRPVYFGVTKVTQTQYQQVMGTNPSKFSATGDGKDTVKGWDTGNHPVENVSDRDALDFCTRLSVLDETKTTRTAGSSAAGENNAPIYRIPTEAEWEFACRAGTQTPFWFGDSDSDSLKVAWLAGNSGRHTRPVGQFRANAFGLHDMCGNVYEWVDDNWDAHFYKQFSAPVVVDPRSPVADGGERVLRGCHWGSNHAFECRSAFRHATATNNHNDVIGFRVVLNVAAFNRRPSDIVINATIGNDRTVAEWVLAHGGVVLLVGHSELISKPELLPAGDFMLKMFRIQKRLPEGARNLISFPVLKSLEFVGLDSAEVSAEGIRKLALQPRLERISCGGTTFTTDHMLALGELKRMDSLFIANCQRLTPQNIEVLATQCPQLSSLNLQGNAQLDDSVVKILSKLKHLQTLQLQNTSVTAAGIAALRTALPKCSVESDVPEAPMSGRGNTALNFTDLPEASTTPTGVLIPSLKVTPDEPVTIEIRVTALNRPSLPISNSSLCNIGPFSIKQYGKAAVSKLEWTCIWDAEAGRQKAMAFGDCELHRPTWLAMVSTGTEIRVFLDGRLVSTTPTSEPGRRDTLSSGIGKFGQFNEWEPFRGLIDEVRISSVARYSQDYAPQDRLNADSDTIALYHFEEGSGNQLTDSSGNGHHGQIIAAKWVSGSIAPVPAAVVAGSRTDLLKVINIVRDVGSGDWTLTDGVLRSASGRLNLPVNGVPPEYDLRLRVERKAAGNGLVVGLTSGGRGVALILDGFRSRGGLSGLEMVNGKGPAENGTGVSGQPLTIDTPVDLRIQVRRTGIKVERDGKPFIEWTGPPEQLSVGAVWDDGSPARLFLGTQADFQIHRLELDTVSAGPVEP